MAKKIDKLFWNFKSCRNILLYFAKSHKTMWKFLLEFIEMFDVG